jgi:hypothetical protein
MDYRPVNYAKLKFGITESRGDKKLPYKWTKEVETSVVGNTIEEVIKYSPKIENTYHEKLGLIKKAKIKLINMKIIHSQGKTTYKL